MCFVQNHAVIFGQHRHFRAFTGFLAHGQIGEEQVVVGNQHIGRGRAPAGIIKKTFVIKFALRAQRRVAFGLNFFPHGFLRHEGQIRFAAVRRFLRPRDDVAQLLQLRRFGEEIGLRFGLGEFALASVIGAAFHQLGAKFEIECLLQQRNIFVDELFLQVDGAGGDHRALAVFHAPFNRRQQIRHCFTGAGAGFDNGDLIFIKRRGDLFEHHLLLRPRFKIFQLLRQWARRRQQFFQMRRREQHHSFGFLRLHDDVNITDVIVDDKKADAFVAQLRGNHRIRLRRLQPAGGMVVYHDIARVRHIRDCRHQIFVAARHDLHGFDDAGALRGAGLGFAEKKNFVATGVTNVQPHVSNGLVGEVGFDFGAGKHGSL
ncbi:MAG: hypothetical protein ALAOOOJD_02880 [bacterium]|nr:hypothetical protein [bacterium]